jgi:ClpP class serine protease
MKKRYPHIMEEISRHKWAITGAAFAAIRRAIESGLGSDDEPIFHGAREEISAQTGKPNPKEFTHGSRIGNVGVIRVEGPITPRASWLTEASEITSSEMIGSDLAKMEADSKIEKIVMVYDTPGGAVTGTSDLAAQIRATNKPVISYVFGIAASAGYWLASAADEIVSVDTGIVGSIGTVLTVWKDKDENWVEIISEQSPLKHADPESKKGKAHYQAVVNDLAQVFIDAVAENRGTTAKNVVKNFGQGGEHAASEALKMGMIDRISTFSDFMADLQAVEPQPEPDKKPGTKTVDNLSEIGGNNSNKTMAPRANAKSERSGTMSDEIKTLTEFLANERRDKNLNRVSGEQPICIRRIRQETYRSARGSPGEPPIRSHSRRQGLCERGISQKRSRDRRFRDLRRSHPGRA